MKILLKSPKLHMALAGKTKKRKDSMRYKNIDEIV